MGYHPETLAFSFLGIYVWHIDPERPTEGQRTDDSCAWFDRRPGEYAAALKELLADTTTMHDLGLTLNRRKHTPMPFYEGVSKPNTDPDRAPGYPRLSQADALAAILTIALELEHGRWWRARRAAPWLVRPFVKRRDVTGHAFDLALNPVDNLSSSDNAAQMARLTAASLNRAFKPWWKHPRWHVHHWRIKWPALRSTHPTGADQ
jgi:hypothetical protein